ncbi:LRR receptor-like serine/threonine-protein kinase IOS1 [Phaseolus vulgaris]
MWIPFYVALLAVLLFHAHAQPGFISIDCGGVNYTDTSTHINYVSDANIINSGVRETISSEISTIQLLRRLRSFPEGKRNCYKINVTRGSKYLIRTTFLYGNYDGRNMLPHFDLLLGANKWATVNINNASNPQLEEIIHVPSLDYVQICLVDTGHGTPFITTIEFRTLKNHTYVTQYGSLKLYLRNDFGSDIIYRYPTDVYDRLWYILEPFEDWTNLSGSISDDSLDKGDYQLRATIMRTAVTPTNASDPLSISWGQNHETDEFYVYMHFTEIQVLTTNQTRQFNIMRNGELWIPNFSPRYLAVDTLYTSSAISEKEIEFVRTGNSTLPPIISALEVYTVIDLQKPETFQGDVDAITSIKSVYGVKRDWQGDPCAPAAYLWDGLNCTYGDDEVPRITTLNLSSSGLSGKIDPSISKLTMLEKLDLSNNSLNDEVPDFLSQLQHLKILNLEKNNLSGSIPSALVEKSKEGSLTLSLGQNPHICEHGQCIEHRKHRNNIVIPLVASICGGLILLGTVTAILWILRRRKSKASMVEKDQSEISEQHTKQEDSLKQSKKQICSHSDICKITNNFNTIVGRGGFGTVYLGYIYDTPVAVKILSPSSFRGYEQFQAEVTLLLRVHHKNLTSLIGYCDEGSNKSLIYEYMANGNLLEHLSGTHSKSKFLSWEDRLRIAVDAALGLEYLQNGCKPPIIHRDVKSSNILLNEHFQAKLSDFGLSKIIPDDGASHLSTVVAGTPGYLDPDYYTNNRLTEKSDVYSFGVVLLEIITGQQVIARNEERSNIIEWVRSLVAIGDIKAIVDSRLEGDFDINSAWKAVEIAMACVSLRPNQRPIMSVVVFELKETLATELARTKPNSSAESIEPVNLDFSAQLIPLAR